MNEPVRIVADWLNDTTTAAISVADVLGIDDFPKDSADSLPTVPTFYDSTRHAFAARGLWPQSGQGVTYPCVVTRFGGVDYLEEPRTNASGGIQQPGTCVVSVIVAQRLQDSDEGGEDVGYLIRAVTNSLRELHKPSNRTARTRNGFTLEDCQSMRVALMPLEHEDNVIAAAVVMTYSTNETTYQT